MCFTRSVWYNGASARRRAPCAGVVWRRIPRRIPKTTGGKQKKKAYFFVLNVSRREKAAKSPVVQTVKAELALVFVATLERVSKNILAIENGQVVKIPRERPPVFKGAASQILQRPKRLW